MTEAQAIQLLSDLADQTQLIRLIGFGLWGLVLANVFASTWRG